MNLQSVTQFIEQFVEGRVTVAAFCDRFEHIYNFELERGRVPETVLPALQGLFDVVVFYSPYPDERALIERYKNDNDVLVAAKDALRVLHKLDYRIL